MPTKAFQEIAAYVAKSLKHAKAKRCCEAGCELGLAELPLYVLLKGEKLVTDRKMCDCVIFVDKRPVLTALVELRSKTTHVDVVIEKLANAHEARCALQAMWSAAF
jgi:hypothetical protein